MIRDRFPSRTMLLATTMVLFVLIGRLEEGSRAQEAGRTARKVSDLERLVAIEEIRQLKARYFRCMDWDDYPCLEGLFTTDAVAEYGAQVTPGEKGPPPLPTLKGRLAIAAQLRRATEKRLTIHHGHMPEIEVTSPTTARGIWAMMDLNRGLPGEPLNAQNGFGHYHETYERIDGRWYIKTIRLTRLRVDR